MSAYHSVVPSTVHKPNVSLNKANILTGDVHSPFGSNFINSGKTNLLQEFSLENVTFILQA